MPDLIGDSLYTEPAIRAKAKTLGEPVGIFCRDYLKPLFDQREDLVLLGSWPVEDDPPEGYDAQFSPLEALYYLRKDNLHFTQAFFSQVGLNYKKYKKECKPIIGGILPSVYIETEGDFICIAPFSHSCSSHTGQPANKTAPVSYWENLVEKLPLPVVSLGALGEPPIKGTENIRGANLRNVASIINTCELYIGGDTGLTCIAGCVNSKIILLNSAIPLFAISPQTYSMFKEVYAPQPLWDQKTILKYVGQML